MNSSYDSKVLLGTWKLLTLTQKFVAVLVMVASAVLLHKRRDFENDRNIRALDRSIINADNNLSRMATCKRARR